MDLGLTRRNIGRLVLLAWAVTLAWLARREFARNNSAAVAERTRRLEPGAQYYAVMAGDRQIGRLNRAVDTMVDGVRLTEQFVIDLPDADSTRPLARGIEYLLSRGLKLRHFTRTVFGQGLPEQLDGGLSEDSLLTLESTEGTTRRRASLRVDPDAILAPMLPYRAAFGRHLTVGQRFELPLIELGARSVRPVSVRVTAESTFVVADSAIRDSTGTRWIPATFDTVRAWRLEHDAPGAPTVSWVDATGAVIQEEIAGGFTLVRSAFEIVENNYRRVRRAESSAWRRSIPGMVSLTASRLIPDTAAAINLFLLRADSGWLADAPHRLGGGRQVVRGDTLIVWRDTPPAGSAGSGPGATEPPEGNAIRIAAARAVGQATTALDSARNLTKWVAMRITTDRSSGAFGTAVNTLREGRGDADGKARLLAAMAEVSGIPARVVMGLAILPAGSFGHAWVELWLGRWIAVDPTFGHFPASASLLRVALLERSRPTDLLPLLASARFLPLGTKR